ncbi:hypothetical protein [Pseudomonas aeruginosa]|uniref:hypothetical protein n=1 Tax=Pseudomonas aeruginosa TaxID=287 RepID=UPI0028801C44|nr:hypothetical protein [Pseudomonas aeruginosa]
MSNEDWNELDESYRSALSGALETAHPAVEQAGGDERAAFEQWLEQHMSHHFSPELDLAKYEDSGEYRYNPAADYWKAWQARAALAQPSPPPHPASELDFSRPLETENGDPVKWICADVIEYKSARVCVAKDTGLVYSSPYIGLKIRNVMPEQAEAERSALWAVHAQGPDELYAAFSREDAEKHAAELNALPMPEGIAVGAVVVPSPWPAVQHWQYLAEQEQDHKNEIAGRLRQFERICEGLPQGAIDGGWTVHGIRGYAKRLEDQLKAAQARVAELEGKLTDWVHEGFRLNEALAVAKAQHSVPIAPELKRALALVVAALEADGDRPTSKYALSELKKVLAAAHVCHLSRNALTEAQMRRLYENSTETENERLGFEAFARLIRRAEAVHQITAAPGKEVGHE